MNLLYCGNKKVFDGLMISLLSITKYCKKPLTVYVMTADLRELNASFEPITEEQTDYLEQMMKKVHAENRIHLIDCSQLFREEFLLSPNIRTSYTPYTLLRLLADKAEQIPERILYLDTDTVACKDISPVFDTDITEYEFAGVSDYLGKWFISRSYINAGILYLNMEKIRETGLFLRTRELCKTKKMWFPDQTALNRLVRKKLFLPGIYNEQRRWHEDTVIQHFCKSIRWLPFFHTVNIKPWEVEKVWLVYKLHAHDAVLHEYLWRKALTGN